MPTTTNSRCTAITILAALLISLTAHAAENTFTGAVNNLWFDDGNWTLGIPDYSHAVVINNGADVLLTDGEGQAKNLELQGNSILRMGKRAKLLFASGGMAAHVGANATIEFVDDNDAEFQEISLRDTATLLLDGTIRGSSLGRIQNGEKALSNMICNGTIDQSVSKLFFHKIILTGSPTILGERALMAQQGEIRLQGLTDIEYISASGYIGGNTSFAAGGYIENYGTGEITTIDLKNIIGVERITLNEGTTHVRYGLDGSGFLADGRTWELMPYAKVYFSGAVVNGIANNTSVEIHRFAEIHQLWPKSIEAGSTLRVIQAIFDGGGSTLVNNGTFEMIDACTLSNIILEGLSPFSIIGGLENVTFRVPVTLELTRKCGPVRCEDATTIIGKFECSLVATGTVENQGRIVIWDNKPVELLGGYTATGTGENGAIHLEGRNALLKMALTDGILDSGGLIDSSDGTIQFVGEPLQTITNNTTYYRSNRVSAIGEEITQVDAGSTLQYHDDEGWFHLAGRTLQIDGSFKTNQALISNGTIQGTGTLEFTKELTLQEMTLDHTLNADFDVELIDAVIAGSLTILGDHQLSGTGSIEGYVSTPRLTLWNGLLEVSGELDLRYPATRPLVVIKGTAHLALTRPNPGAPFDYGSNWQVKSGGIIELVGESDTQISLAGETHIVIQDPQFPGNFSFNHIDTGSTLENESKTTLDLNASSLDIDGALILHGPIVNGTINGSGIVQAIRMDNMTIHSNARLDNNDYDTFATNTTFNGSTTLYAYTPNSAELVDVNFNGPLEVFSSIDAVGGTINILGEITPVWGGISAFDGAHVRIDLGPTNGHLIKRLSLVAHPGGILEILGDPLTTIDTDANLGLAGGEIRNVALHTIQPEGRLYISEYTFDLAGATIENNGEIRLAHEATLSNGTLTGDNGLLMCSSLDSKPEPSIRDLIVQHNSVVQINDLRMENATLEKGLTVHNGQTLFGSGAVHGTILLSGAIVADIDSQTLTLAGPIQGSSIKLSANNNATLQIDPETFGPADILIQNATLTLDNPLTTNADVTLIAQGTINGQLTNAKDLRITNDNQTLGELTINGTYTQEQFANVNLKISAANPGEFDQLIINGHAQLDGPLNLIPINGYRADFNEEIQILKWTSHSGRFSSVILPPINFPRKMGRWVVEYRAGGLYLRTVRLIRSAKSDQ